jgi:hypothetical protein
MCSLRFSPVPTPRKKRPGIIAAAVAAAWAIIAGWIRMVGQVTPVPRYSLVVAWAIPPMTLQAKKALPLLIYPGVIVIRYQGESETCLLGPSGTGDQIIGSMLFAGKGVADLEHNALSFR